MAQDDKREKLESALFDRAVGFVQEDVSEEFGMVDNSLQLIKRKTSKKYYPPEIRAIELMLEQEGDGDVGEMSLEELKKERTKLKKLLEKAEKNDKENKEKRPL